MSELLKDTSPLTTEQEEYIHHISNSAEILLVLVTDILDFARLQVCRIFLKFSWNFLIF
jgi:signal transduction histidine kinase